MEVFLEHPAMVAGEPSGTWAVHVTRLEDFAPVASGLLTLRFQGPDGTVYTTEAEPVSPGHFAPEPVLPEAGSYRVLAEVRSPSLQDRVLLGDVTVHAPGDSVPHPAESAGGITFLKERQWSVSFGVHRVRSRGIPPTVEVSGSIEAAGNQMARVAAPVSGLVRVSENRSLPAPGDRVEAGQRLAVLAPAEGQGSYAELKARVERLRREVRRLERLYEVRTVSEVRLQETRRALEVAEATLEAMGGGGGQGYSYVVRAPISGVLDRRMLTLGSRVQPGDPLFTVIDPDTVWVRLDVPAEYGTGLDGSRRVTFRPEGAETYQVAEHLVSLGEIVETGSRTLPVRFAVPNRDRALKVGMMLDGRLQVGAPREGVAIPEAAIQREDGTPVAYVQTGGETFERRVLTLGPSDGRYTLVEEGLAPNEFVVTQGAYQVHLASLGTEELSGHGHTH